MSTQYLDNGEQQGFDVAGGVCRGVSALEEGRQQGPLTAGPAHCCDVHLAPPHLDQQHVESLQHRRGLAKTVIACSHCM